MTKLSHVVVDVKSGYNYARSVLWAFAPRYGFCNCRQLPGGCDLTTEAGRAEFKRQDLFNKVCVPCVGAVCRILEDLFKE